MAGRVLFRKYPTLCCCLDRNPAFRILFSDVPSSHVRRELMIKPKIIYSNLYTSVIKSVCEKHPLMLYICFSRFVLALAYDLAYAVYGLGCTLYHITHQYKSVPLQFSSMHITNYFTLPNNINPYQSRV